MDINSMMGLIINLVLFIFFFVMGLDISYDDRVIGFVFITFSGILFLSMTTMTILTGLLHPVYVIPFLDPVGVYILIYGAWKIGGKLYGENKNERE